MGKPEGLTLEQFQIAIRTGHDPITNDAMPWPIYRHMTGQDLDAIYTYLSVLPPATPGSCTGAGEQYAAHCDRAENRLVRPRFSFEILV